jgi:hypothetical protein
MGAAADEGEWVSTRQVKVRVRRERRRTVRERKELERRQWQE